MTEAQKSADFAHSETKIAQDSVKHLKNLLTEAQKSTDLAYSKAKTAQDTANTIHSEIKLRGRQSPQNPYGVKI